jgi:hypothetical protein
MPATNWTTHQNDTAYIVLRDLHDIVKRSGKLEAKVHYTPPRRDVRVSENLGLGGWLTTRIPVRASEKMASVSVKKFSARIGHDLSYRMLWSNP